MMSDNDWSPEALLRKTKDIARTPGLSDSAKLEAVQVLIAQYADHAQVKPKQETEA